MADLISPILLVAGALILLIGWVGGWAMRGASNDPGSGQARDQAKKALARETAMRRQLAAAHDASMRLFVDPRTREDTKLYLEREVIPRLKERGRNA